jgi:hypothetical protein
VRNAVWVRGAIPQRVEGPHKNNFTATDVAVAAGVPMSRDAAGRSACATPTNWHKFGGVV